jgi:hypothetical protein
MYPMTAKPAPESVALAAADGLLLGGLDGARTWARIGADAWSRSFNGAGRAAMAAQSVTADYADKMLKLNLSAVPRTLPRAADEWMRPLAAGGELSQLYIAYLHDCGRAVAAALRKDETA